MTSISTKGKLIREATLCSCEVESKQKKAEINIAGNWQPVVSQSEDVFLADHAEFSGPFFSPNVVFWSIFMLVLLASLVAFKHHFSLRFLDFIFFLIYGFT